MPSPHAGVIWHVDSRDMGLFLGQNVQDGEVRQGPYRLCKVNSGSVSLDTIT
jgi:hypothetical protein